MHILVTGNLGYVGSHLAKLLLEQGYQVTGCDLNLFPAAVCGRLPVVNLQSFADFRSITEEDLRGVDAVVHLAALSNDALGSLDPELTMSVNGTGVVELAKRAKIAGVRKFIFSSSCSVYGVSGDIPVTEKDRVHPQSEYAKSKVLAEVGIAELTDSSFEVYILRNATAFGVSPVFRSDLVVNDLCASLIATGEAVIHSSEDTWRPLINCKDMARAFELFVNNNVPQISGKPVNIGFTEENFQLKYIREMIKGVFGESKIKQDVNGPASMGDYRVGFGLFKSVFPEFEPLLPLALSIEPLKRELIRIGYNLPERVSKRYVRLVEFTPKIKSLKDF